MTERVLIVDDHPLTRDALRGLLSANGFEVVVEASSGAEAIELAEQVKPDLVLLDVMMQGTSGLDVIEHLRRQFLRPVDAGGLSFGVIEAGRGLHQRVEAAALGPRSGLAIGRQ